jgi:hypothetical protein
VRVEIVTCTLQDGRPVKVEARVQGRQRPYVVDFDPAWSDGWLCSCGYGPDCSHVRAVRRELDLEKVTR